MGCIVSKVLLDFYNFLYLQGPLAESSENNDALLLTIIVLSDVYSAVPFSLFSLEFMLFNPFAFNPA